MKTSSHKSRITEHVLHSVSIQITKDGLTSSQPSFSEIVVSISSVIIHINHQLVFSLTLCHCFVSAMLHAENEAREAKMNRHYLCGS